jgi:hypothetical protein
MWFGAMLEEVLGRNKGDREAWDEQAVVHFKAEWNAIIIGSVPAACAEPLDWQAAADTTQCGRVC